MGSQIAGDVITHPAGEVQKGRPLGPLAGQVFSCFNTKSELFVFSVIHAVRNYCLESYLMHASITGNNYLGLITQLTQAFCNI